MAKVTKKLQITLPKAVATELGIGPGTELSVEAAGDVVRLRPIEPTDESPRTESLIARLEAFDEASERQRQRDAYLRAQQPEIFADSARGWKREDLYDRGLPR